MPSLAVADRDDAAVPHRKGVKDGMFADIPAHIAVSGILGMCNWLHVWFNEKGKVSPDEIATRYASLLSQGYERRT